MNKRRIRPLEGNSYSGFESGDEHKDNSMTDLDQTTRTEMEAATFRRLLQHLDEQGCAEYRPDDPGGFLP